jgi:hypothetical protein
LGLRFHHGLCGGNALVGRLILVDGDFPEAVRDLSQAHRNLRWLCILYTLQHQQLPFRPLAQRPSIGFGYTVFQVCHGNFVPQSVPMEKKDR